MATEEVDHSSPDEGSQAGPTGKESTAGEDAASESPSNASVGDYSWADFMAEYGYEHEIDLLYPHGTSGPDDQLGLDTDEEARSVVPSGDDWERVDFDPTPFVGYDPDALPSLITEVFAPNAKFLEDIFHTYVDPETTPVVKGFYTWEHYKWEFYYTDDGSRPRDSSGEIDPFDSEDALGFEPASIEEKLYHGANAAMELDDVIEERTVNVNEELDEDKFFSTAVGGTTVANRYDLEKAVPMAKKRHFREVERYWVNKPYAFVVIFHSKKENEKKYYAVEPYLNEIEEDIQEFLSGKLRTAIKYSDDGIKHTADEAGRREVIEEETRRLLKRYDLFEKTSGETKEGIIQALRTLLDDDESDPGAAIQLEGISTRPEPAILADDPDTLTEYQVEKLLYLLKRNFLGYELIDPIKHDINVEDISCDGYNSPVFVYHSGYEQIISNVYHGEEELDDFVIKLAQRSGKGISKRLPQVDTTLPDGSRAQLTLGKEVSDHGTNYTIRQFKDVPFTPIDLINWNTFSLDEMAYLWLAIENHKSLIFAGGTASGKTTSLNAVSLFIPSNTKIVSIEDTREVELPQRNWIASVTRPSFSDDDQGDVDEFDLLEAALRQRPDYIVMGEIRGEEGRTLFQVMSTGHTTYTTFHADSVDEVLKRFTTDPINVSKTMFTALDLVSIQTQTRVQGTKVRRNKSLTEINHYEAENDEINVQDVYQWQAETDEYLKMGDSNTLEEIKFDRGWTDEKLEEELFKRQVILAYLIKNGLNTYAEVAATVQAFINDPETILTLVANDALEHSLEDLREMESVLIDVDPEKEELVPRPDASDETYNLSTDLLERAEESLFDEYRGKVPSGLASALEDVEPADSIDVDRADVDEFDFGGDVDETVSGDAWDLGDGSSEFGFDEVDSPEWLEDDGFEMGDEAVADDGDPATATAPETEAGTAGPEPEPEPGSEPGTGPAGATFDASDATEADATGESPPALEGAAEETATPPSSAPPLESSPDTEREVGSFVGDRPDDGTDPIEAGPVETDDGNGATDDGVDANDASDARDGAGPRPAPETFDDPVSDAVSDAAPSSDHGGETEAGDSIEGLFSDMGSTLDELENPNRGVETSGTGAEGPIPDTSGFDSMFPDRDLDSIFGDGPPTEEAGDDADRSPPTEAKQDPDLGEEESEAHAGDGAAGDDESGVGDGEAGAESVFDDDGESVFDAADTTAGGVDSGDSIFTETDADTDEGLEDDGESSMDADATDADADADADPDAGTDADADNDSIFSSGDSPFTDDDSEGTPADGESIFTSEGDGGGDATTEDGDDTETTDDEEGGT